MAIKRAGSKIKRRPAGRPFTKDDPRRHPPRWKPGESGNPAGRPPEPWSKAELKRAMQEFTPEATARLMQIVRDGRDTAARMAIETVYERGYGQAKQEIDLELTGRVTVAADEDAALRAISGELDRIAERVRAAQDPDKAKP